MDEIKIMLEEELKDLLGNMKDMDPTSEEYCKTKVAANDIADRLIEIEKIRDNHSIEEMKQEGELARLANNLDVEKIKQSIPKSRIVTDAAKIVMPPLLYFLAEVWGINKAQIFERSGYTLIMKSSQEIKNFLSKMIKF